MLSRVIILGSTGSIGISTLKVIRQFSSKFVVTGLSCHKNIALLKEQIREFNPQYVAVSDEQTCNSDDFKTLKKEFGSIVFYEGLDGLCQLVTHDADILVVGIVGAAALKPTLEALPHVKRIAIANKETLVMAGDLFLRLLNQYKVELLPVDSEHCAIFTLLDGKQSNSIKRIILTASGGSVRHKPIDALDTVTVEEALMHPTWDMGKKITIDSATLMNKGLEVIEAHYLFSLPYEAIDVIIHPESIVHGMVELVDGTLLAHMSITDMVYPIQKALNYPEVVSNNFGSVDLLQLSTLHFAHPDSTRYPALGLCYEAGKKGGTAPAVLNAANEIAVQAFLHKKIAFTKIVSVVEKVLYRHKCIDNPDLAAIFAADAEARQLALTFI
ncbi:MAG: 1-deoxy-D-xylulose-5-phosphate reductoisomerase [Spirochaetes bacterium]|nr:1-deoxy-D-xylulose-5-phosphate reductoisomerase [Spirochaetota bacterium]